MTEEASIISADVPDWSREEKKLFKWHPSRSLLASIRAYQSHPDSRNIYRYLERKFAVLRHRFWSVVTGADIPLNCQLGGGLMIPHPNGVVIHPASKIGVNCIIFQQVTIGDRHGGVPDIGGNVEISAGAKILGAIRIGNGALIGANAVVLTDVPDNMTAMGVPAAIFVRGKTCKN